MTLYAQIQAEKRAARIALERIYQPLDYAVARVSTIRPGLAQRRVSIRIEMPSQPIAPDAVLQDVRTVRSTKDRGS